MGKRTLIILLAFLFTGAVVLIWFVQDKGKSLVTDPIAAIPPDACILFDPSDLPDFLTSVTEGNRLFSLLEKFKVSESFCEGVSGLRKLANTKQARELLENSRTVFSFHFVTGGKLCPLFSMNIQKRSKYRMLLDLLSSAGNAKTGTISVDGITIDRVLFRNGSVPDTVYIAFRGGLALGSTSSELLVRSASKKSHDPDIRSVAGFTRIMSAAGRKEDKVYLIFRNFAGILRHMSGEKNPAFAEKFAKLADCASADIHISDNGLILSGYAESTDTSEILYRYKSRETTKLTSYEILPSDVLLFETILLKENHRDTAGIKDLDKRTATLARALSPYIGNEITRAVLERGSDINGINDVIIYKLLNREMAEQVLSSSFKEWCDGTGISREKMTEYFQPDEQTKIPVISTPYRNLSGAFNYSLNPGEGDSLFAFSDNYLISGNSFTAIRKVLYDNILNKTLANDLSYRDFESTLPSKAGYYFYCQPADITDYLSRFLSDTVSSLLNAGISQLEKIRAFGFQLAASNEMIYSTVSVKLGDTAREATGAVWETKLDTCASIKPFFFTNHNTGSREIFIQDYRNNVYLINSAGRVLWKVSAGERITGNVYMIDFFNNGKFQILFAGKNNLYLLDRNGNNVEKFPARLRAPASGPPALFDYDGTGDLRILIPGEDRMIYAYDKEGNVVKGWKPFRTGGTVRSEIKFFRVSGKDYLVAADDQTLYFLDRTGNQRLRLREPVVKAGNSEMRLDNNGYPGIILSEPEGSVVKVSFDGIVVKTDLGRFSVDHSFDFFDVDGDGFGEYVFIDRGILYLYRRNRSELFRRDFGSSDLEGPVFFIFSASDRKIGITDITRKLIYLVDKKGNTMTGFPRKGASVFSIGRLSEKGDFRLIVGGDDNFLYNYKLDTGN